MKTFWLVVFIALTLAIFANLGFAQTQTTSLPLGTVTGVNRLAGCPPGLGNGATCYNATVSCPGTVDAGFTYAYATPRGTPQGTIVLFSGANGMNVGIEGQYFPTYTSAGFQTVLVLWNQPWEDTGTTPDIKTAACRPATVLNYIHQTIYRRGGMCAQGFSAGSAAVAYSLAEYGAGTYLDNVELLSGPVLSDIATGCNHNSPKMMVCGSGCNTGKPSQGGWMDSPQFITGGQKLIDSWTEVGGGNACVTGNASQSQLDAWKKMSIVDGLSDSTFRYPQTAMAGWVCSDTSVHCQGSSCQNNSAAEGQIFYDQITNPVAPFAVYRVNQCHSNEGVNTGYLSPPNNGQMAFVAISNDMINNCTLRH